MKILKKALRQGLISLAVDSLDDLWHLSQVVSKGDLVKGKTTRKVKATEKEASKKTLTLEIMVGEVEFSDGSLRISGTTTEELEDIPKGSHHTISVEDGSVISITKMQWPDYMLRRLVDASVRQSPAIILALDREEAVFALLKSQGYEILAQVRGKVAKKGYETVTGDFYAELAGKLSGYDSRFSPGQIIIGSPAFWKEEMLARLPGELAKKVVLATCNSVGPTAVDEIMKRPELKSVLKQQRAAEEARAVDSLMAEISRDGMAAYGIKEVESAVDAGNVSKLLITDRFISRNRATSERLMRGADAVKGDVVIINSENDAGRKLDSLGGTAAMLRYKNY